MIFWVTWDHKEVIELDIDLYNRCWSSHHILTSGLLGFNSKLYSMFLQFTFILFLFYFYFLKTSYTCLQHMHQKTWKNINNQIVLQHEGKKIRPLLWKVDHPSKFNTVSNGRWGGIGRGEGLYWFFNSLTLWTFI